MLLGSRPDVLEADEPEREAPRSAKLEARPSNVTRFSNRPAGQTTIFLKIKDYFARPVHCSEWLCDNHAVLNFRSRS